MQIKSLYKPLVSGETGAAEIFTKTCPTRLRGILLVMKLTTVLLFAVMLQATAKSNAQTVTYAAESVSLEKVFVVIKQQTGYVFFYREEDIRGLPAVSVSFRNTPLGAALQETLKGQPLQYNIQGNTIFITAADIGRRKAVVPKEIISEDLAIEISGVVRDKGGAPLEGVSVTVKGTQMGTTTNADGRFQLSVSSVNNLELVFSFVGYATQTVKAGSRTVFDIVLEAHIAGLEDVVITAFGIEREKKALTYSVQEIKGESVSGAGNSNLINGLQGKIAGVNTWLSSGEPGSSHTLTIRGMRSITGDNSPLYVIDGLPISGGSRVIDINPSDIKSISVLKGPTAAALYGLRASNGVILIETKDGSGGVKNKTSITFATSYNFDRMSRYPDLQKTYAQGVDGIFDPYSFSSWGPRIDTMGSYINQLGEEEEARAYDNLRDFMQTGGTFNANLNIAKAVEKGNYGFSLGTTSQDGIINYSDLKRMNAKIAVSQSLTSKLKMGATVNYVSNVTHNKPVAASSDWWAYFGTPPSYNLKGKPTHVPGDPYQQINYRGQHDNLYWMIEHNRRTMRTARVFGSIDANYDPLKWLNVSYRIGIDNYNGDIKTVIEKGSGPGRSVPPSGGSITDYMNQSTRINSTLNVSVNRRLGNNINLNVLVGDEFYDIRDNFVQTIGTDIVIGGFHNISNTRSQKSSTGLNRQRGIGNYANVGLSWKNMLFLNGSGRNDIVSNMPSHNRSFFYPSIGGGFIFSELMDNNSMLSYGKVRASVAEVGQAGPIYSTHTLFNSGAAVGGFSWPYAGLNAFTLGNNLNSSDLMTENTRTFEVGLELRLFDNRISLDYSYYRSNSVGQIYRVPIALSTGFSSELRNAGEMRVDGHELVVSFTPITKPNFTWNLIANFSAYKNKVISLAKGIEELGLGGSFINLVARPGSAYPLLKGIGYARDPKTGEIVVDSRQYLNNGSINSSYGYPLRAPNEIILGKAQPDFLLGFTNEFRLYNFTLSAQIDWKRGGKVMSGITNLAYAYGVLAENADRENDFIFPGMKGFYKDGELTVAGVNDVPIRQTSAYALSQYSIKEGFVEDASFLKLREVRLSYSLSQKLTQSKFLNSAQFFVRASNIRLYSGMKYLDPEMYNTSIGEEYLSYPQIKSFGFGLEVKF